MGYFSEADIARKYDEQEVKKTRINTSFRKSLEYKTAVSKMKPKRRTMEPKEHDLEENDDYDERQ